MSEEEIFHEALARNPADRAAYLDHACAGDPALRAAVQALLRANVGASGFMASPGSAVTVDLPADAEAPGTVIGPYKLLEQIGEGGMGTVWMAQQTEPVKRVVALKLVKAGMDSRQVVARFEAERQALALMDHPNIAKVLDAGTIDGRPYFVMELVKGTSITQFCDERRLSTRERLELFVPVCQAVQHAHQKGIIHRDVKPSNVLVALHDEKAVPKVIDFGVAKAVAQQLTEKTLHTGFGTLVGTPSYMAPEQATFNQLDIDTRADIYSLGVLLYELLTGSTPVDLERLKSEPLDELLRQVREEEPPRPSQRLSTSEARASIAAVRRSEPARLAKLLRGELDWVVMKALEKDRNRRYEAANSFAMDVQRYLNHEPVHAHPPSRWYRLRKLGRRHRGALAAMAMLGFLLFATIAVLVFSRAEILTEQAATKVALDNEREANQALQDALAREHRHQNSLRVALAHRHWLSLDLDRARQLLDECPPELRDDEWRRLHRLCHSELVRIDVGGAGVGYSPLRYSPDGKLLAGTVDTKSRVWDAVSGRELFALAGNAARISRLDFSPDGRHAIGMGHQPIRDDKPGLLFEVNTWELGEGKLVKSRTQRWNSGPDQIQIGPDGRRVGTNNVRSFSMKDIDGGHELSTFELTDLWLPKIAYSADWRYVAGICGGFQRGSWIQVWDTTSGKVVHTIKDLPSPPMQVAASGDGRRLVSVSWNINSTERKLFAWDAATKVPRFIGQVKLNALIAFGPGDRQLAVVDDDRVIRIWDVESWTEELALRGHTGPINSIAFSPDGLRLASSAADSSIRIWDVRPLESEIRSQKSDKK
jgi:serine/threonine protein kinase